MLIRLSLETSIFTIKLDGTYRLGEYVQGLFTQYRLGPLNSKSFVDRVFLRIKLIFELHVLC